MGSKGWGQRVGGERVWGKGVGVQGWGQKGWGSRVWGKGFGVYLEDELQSASEALGEEKLMLLLLTLLPCHVGAAASASAAEPAHQYRT